MRRRTLPTLMAMATLAAAAACGAGSDGPGSDDDSAAMAGPAATDIYLVSLTGDGESIAVEGAPTAVTDRDGYDNQPFFTPAGDAILYSSIGDDGQADSWRYDLASGESARLTQTPESEYSPTPIPGAERFAVIRVEADSTQRLWSFAMDGTDPRLVLQNVAPVGYQAWASPDRVALFVLGDPPTLRLAETASGEATVMAENIGRSLQKVPGRGAITFTQQSDGGWRIRELDPATGRVSDVAPLMGADEYHVWTPGGTLLTASGTTLYRWSEDAGGDAASGGEAGEGGASWQALADLGEHGLGQITRLAMAPDGGRLAVVVNR